MDDHSVDLLFIFLMCNLNSYEQRLTHKALTLAFKTLYKLGLNITALLRSGTEVG